MAKLSLRKGSAEKKKKTPVAKKAAAPKKSAQKPSKKPKKAKAPGKNRMLKLLVAGIVAAGILIGGTIWVMDFLETKKIEEHYQKTIASVDKEKNLDEKQTLLLDFINSTKPNDHTDDVKNRLEKVRKEIEKRDFNAAVKKVKALPVDDDFEKKATAVYRQYLKQYPDGEHTNNINQHIAQTTDGTKLS